MAFVNECMFNFSLTKKRALLTSLKLFFKNMLKLINFETMQSVSLQCCQFSKEVSSVVENLQKIMKSLRRFYGLSHVNFFYFLVIWIFFLIPIPSYKGEMFCSEIKIYQRVFVSIHSEKSVLLLSLLWKRFIKAP